MRCLIFVLLFMSMCALTNAQISPGVYLAQSKGVQYELKMTTDYFILSTYETQPAKFLQTIGGFFEIEENELKVDLEFNSDFEKDSVQHVDIPFQEEGGILIFRTNPKIVFNRIETNEQELDGHWLFATRGPDKGQERRGDSNPRKTLKVLTDGRFQWIAYNTETMQFFGSGGGAYTSEDGKYVETIEYFSRDNARVGARLPFDYEIKDKDWHHQGLNSKGEAMYEIWSLRN